jgi:site-specific DNA-methyltransferase (adenine-specific)
MTPNSVFDDLVKYIAKNGTTESIKPIFKTDDFCLYKENCMTVMAKFPDNYVDMIFADPPYNLSNNGVTCYAGKMVSVNKGEWDKSKGLEKDFEFHLQ